MTWDCGSRYCNAARNSPVVRLWQAFSVNSTDSSSASRAATSQLSVTGSSAAPANRPTQSTSNRAPACGPASIKARRTTPTAASNCTLVFDTVCQPAALLAESRPNEASLFFPASSNRASSHVLPSAAPDHRTAAVALTTDRLSDGAGSFMGCDRTILPARSHPSTTNTILPWAASATASLPA